jgi:hypothetical protein
MDTRKLSVIDGDQGHAARNAARQITAQAARIGDERTYLAMSGDRDAAAE